MATMVDFRVIELLCSRICHDLISPVGAINNGVELIEELGDRVVDEAIGLIGASARKTSGHLQFFRMAYGFAGSQSIQSFREARELLEGFLDGGKIGLDWPDAALPETMPAPGWGKLLLNQVSLAAEGLPRGGTLAIMASSTPLRLEVSARGDDARLSDELKAALDPDIAIDALSARTVLAYFTAVAARRLEASIEVVASQGEFTITAAPAMDV